MRNSKIALKIPYIIFYLSFLAALVILSVRWIKRTFGAQVEITQILFHIQAPIIGNIDTIFYISFMLKVLIPAFLIAYIIAFPNGAIQRFCIRFIKFLYHLIATFISNHLMSIRVAVCVGLCIFAVIFAYKKLDIQTFLDSIDGRKHYTNFYETYYIPPPMQEINKQFSALKSPRNAIVIFAESLESSYSAKNIPIGGGADKS